MTKKSHTPKHAEKAAAQSHEAHHEAHHEEHVEHKLFFGQLLSATIKVCQDNVAFLLKLMLLIYFVPNLIFSILPFIFYPNALAKLGNFDTLFSVANLPFLALLGLSAVISIITSMFLSVSLIKSMSETKRERKVKEVISDSMKLFFPFLGLSFLEITLLAIIPISAVALLFALNIWAGLIAALVLVFPVILMVFSWIFSCYALIIDNKGIIGSLKESYSLVKGKWWRIFGYYIAILLISVGISLVGGIPQSLLAIILDQKTLPALVFNTIFQLLTSMAVSAFITIFFMLFYEKLKKMQ